MRIRANVEELDAVAYCLNPPVKESRESSFFSTGCLKTSRCKTVVQECSQTWSEGHLDTTAQTTKTDRCLHVQSIQYNGGSGHDSNCIRYFNVFSSGEKGFINHFFSFSYLNPADQAASSQLLGHASLLQSTVMGIMSHYFLRYIFLNVPVFI